MTRPPPQVHAMVVCDQVFQQAGTGKWCVIGTHGAFTAPQVPHPHVTALFLSLGDFASGTTFQLVVRHEDGEMLCQAEAVAGTGQQVSTVDFGLQLPTLQFPREGVYHYELLAQGKVLAARELRIAAGTPAANPPPQPPLALEARALVLCDLAFPQHDVAKWHLIGVYDAITVPALPARHAPFVVYWSLTGFLGEAHVMATVRDNEGAVVYAMRTQTPKLPGGPVEHAFAFPPIEFKRAGSHTLELHVGDRLLAVRSFLVQVGTPAPRTS